ncbi:MAG: glycosyltransferase family 4 protein [Bacteroidetes bacterium]|uniref:Glycosyltransferase family 4 protein n=1 Tax=Candidatus Cryptobacteroides merdavium TaxID=2840769 RepID=A0A9D9EBJ9_9BACT|nr:glycosyltransferase family 4 protein [Candidatus Cryptobacteroides merdavium]
MKKILIITPFIPYPVDSGGNQAFFSMVDYQRKTYDISVIFPVHRRNMNEYKALMQLWPDLTFYPYFLNKDKSSAILNNNSLYFKLVSKVLSVAKKERRKWMSRNISDIINDERKFKYHSSLFNETCSLTEGFMKHVREVSCSHDFDLIQVEFYNFVPFKFLFPENVKTLYIQHEIQFVRLANEMSLFQETTMTDKALYELKKLEEIALLNQYDHIITLTETDRNILSRYVPGHKLDVSPAIICNISKTSGFSECSDEFVFVGGNTHFPNFDGINWFCNNVIPILREKNMKFRLYIIGAWKRKIARMYAKKYPELIFTGYISDLEPFLNGKISIVPIRIGSGMRIKIMDAVYAKSPFVTTCKGVEGLEFKDGTDCLISDSAETFADNMIRLSADTELQRRLAENSYSKVRAAYDPKKLKERRAEIYRKYLE